MITRVFYFIEGVVFFASLVGCSHPTLTEQTTVATIGDHKISVHDFRISYELSPATPMTLKNKSSNKRKAHLNSLIENQLLSIEGYQKGLENSESVKSVLKWYEKQAVIRELYRKEIHDKVTISEDEIKDAFVLLNEKAFVRQILVSSRKKAEDIYRRVRTGESFQKIAMDVATSEAELEHILTGDEFTWGELEENLETAIFGLNKNEISVPIKSSSGYHIIQLLNRKKNLILNEYEYQQKRHYIETIIRRRKEAKLSRQYAMSMMEKLQPKAVGPVLLELTTRAKQALKHNEEYKLPPYYQISKIKPSLSDLNEKKLVIFNGGSWTVGQFIDLISHAHPKARPDLTDAKKLAVALSVLVRDEFLAKKGYERHLEKDEQVISEIQSLKDDIVAMRMRNALLDSVTVSKEDIKKFYAENSDKYKTPAMVHVKEIMVRKYRVADSLYAAIINGASIEKLALKYSVRKWAAKKGGDLGFITKDAFGKIGQLAFTMKKGVLGKPVSITVDNVPVGYSIFKVIGKKPAVTPSLKTIYKKVSEDALKNKQQFVLNQFWNSMQKVYPVSINETVLDSIKTTDQIGKGRPIDLLKISRL